MEIEGTYTLQASPEDVWQCLMDEQVLRRAIPGIEHLEVAGEHAYAITLYIKHAPLIGSYHGLVTIAEQHYPYYYHIAIEGEGRQSAVNAEGIVHLSGRGDNTIVAYKGTLNIGKPGTLLPPPLVKGTVKLLLQQFFTALAEYLRTIEHSLQTKEIDQDRELSGQSEEQFTFFSVTAQPTLLYTLVHQLRLGGGDPALEEQWVNRIRRVGVVFGLLLLVWVGTRLPRRPGF